MLALIRSLLPRREVTVTLVCTGVFSLAGCGSGTKPESVDLSGTQQQQEKSLVDPLNSGATTDPSDPTASKATAGMGKSVKSRQLGQ